MAFEKCKSRSSATPSILSGLHGASEFTSRPGPRGHGPSMQISRLNLSFVLSQGAESLNPASFYPTAIKIETPKTKLDSPKWTWDKSPGFKATNGGVSKGNFSH